MAGIAWNNWIPGSGGWGMGMGCEMGEQGTGAELQLARWNKIDGWIA